MTFAPSLAERLAALPLDLREEALSRLGPEKAAALRWDWSFWARPSQLAPEGDWFIWLVLAGRGFGKTRLGAEWVRAEVDARRAGRIAIVADTAADARDVLVEGASGLLSIYPPAERPTYEPSKRRVTWRNGATATLYSAEDPDQLRGPQHDLALADEVAKWRYMRETFDQLMFGLRLGSRPRMCITTTPRPVPLIRELLARGDVAVTRGGTKENRANLAATFWAEVNNRYAGTRLGRQELDGEVVDDVPGALWTRKTLDEARVREDALPPFRRVVVAVDPAVTSGEEADETGIIAVALGEDGRAYVLADASLVATPQGWASRAVSTMDLLGGDALVVEVNQGGEMCSSTIRSVRPSARILEVRATRGKHVRAEPISALYEQGRVSHVGGFPELEDQMCLPAGTLIETSEGKKAIELIVPGDLVMTRKGFAPVKASGKTGKSSVIMAICTPFGTLEATPCHPVFDPTKQRFVSARSVLPSDRLLARLSAGSTAIRSHGADGGGTRCHSGISGTRRGSFSIGRFGSLTADLFRLACSFITSTRTPGIIASKTSPSSTRDSISTSIDSGSAPTTFMHVKSAGMSSRRDGRKSPGTVEIPVLSVRAERRVEDVYNLEVEPGYMPEYFANGILVHNCLMTAQGYLGDRSPDRLDALVWALTALFPNLIRPVASPPPVNVPPPPAGQLDWMNR